MSTRVASIAHPLSAILIATAALAAFACLLPTTSSAACETTVVVSADLKPYQEVLEGLREASECHVREVKLRDNDVLERIHRKPPDVVVAIGTDAFRKVRSLRDVPLVHVMVIPAEAERGVGGKRSGVSMDIAPGTWLETIKRVFPNARRVGLLYNAENTGAFVAEAQRAAPEAGIELAARNVRGPDDVPAALTGMQNAIDLLWMLPDPTVAAPPLVEHLIRYSIQHRIPIMTFSRKYLDMGAVASLDVDPREMGLQAGELVNCIVRGTCSGGRRYARKPRLSINGKAADKMGVALSRAMREAASDD